MTAPAPSLARLSTPRNQFAPISGFVLNATTRDPIPGAKFHYYGLGDLSDAQRGVLHRHSLKGEAQTGADGRYTLPSLPPGNFHIRGGAHGFLADLGNGREGLALDLRLQPNALGLQSFSDVALAEFALPMEFSGRENHASAFTADGNRFAFFTVDTINFPLTEKAIPNTPPFQRCVAWIYDLMSSTLTPVNQSEEPYACESTAIAWDGSTFHTNSFPYINPQTRSPPVAERVTAQNSTVLPPTSLPKAVQDQFALDAAETTAAENLAYPGTSQQTANSLSYGAPRAAETVALSS